MLKQEYPKIKAPARQEKADIYIRRADDLHRLTSENSRSLTQNYHATDPIIVMALAHSNELSRRRFERRPARGLLGDKKLLRQRELKLSSSGA